MITERDLREAIAECRSVKDPTATTCMKLAAYYTIQDHLYGESNLEQPKYSYAAAPSMTVRPEVVGYSGDSEFSQAVSGKDANDVMLIMDELMDTLSVINPRLYEGVMTKLLY